MKNQCLATVINCLAGLMITLSISGCTKSLSNPAATIKPVANFGFTINGNGNTPLTVAFADSSVNGETYQWDFGDGNHSFVHNPAYTFKTGKTYSVKLVVSNKAGKDSITKQISLVSAKLLSGFTYTKTNWNLPAIVNFTNSSPHAKSYLWNFNDGSTSTLPNPQHKYIAGNSYIVKLIVMNGKKCDSSLQLLDISPFLLTYTSFDNTNYNLYSWEGKYVTLLMRTPGLDAKTMFNWARTMDSCYTFYENATGQVPAENPQRTYLDYHTTIADVATTCGAGCGYLGATGIEMQNTYTDRMYNYILQDNEYDQELFYEFGRNFWFYGNQLAYKTNDPITTGYAVFMRFRAMDATKVKPAPFNNTPWVTFKSTEQGLVDMYVADTTYNWANTLGAGLGIANPLGLGATDLFSSFLMRIARDYGGDNFVNHIWKNAALRPAAVTTQNAVDNFVLATCATANKNLTKLFMKKWRWPLSASAQAQAKQYPL